MAEPEDDGRRRLHEHRERQRQRERQHAAAGRADRRRGRRRRARRDGQPTRDEDARASTCRSRLASAIACSSPSRVRSDQNSAFGTNFQRVFYPKVSLSWIISDESFFPKCELGSTSSACASRTARRACSRARRRAAHVLGDRRSNIANIDTSGLRENALGNPNLKPETSAEFEGGFETRVFDNRVNLDVTYYNKKTKDALISQPIAPSAAPSATTRSHEPRLGAEHRLRDAASTRRFVDRTSFGWDMTVCGSHNSNKVVSLGVDPAGNPDKTIGTGALARLGRLAGQRVCSAAVSLRRRERRRHHSAERSHGRHRRRLRRLLFAARPRVDTERIRSVQRGSCASTSCSTTRAGSTLINNTCVVPLPAVAAGVPGGRDRVDAAVAAGARGGDELRHGRERHASSRRRTAIARTVSSGGSAKCRRRSTLPLALAAGFARATRASSFAGRNLHVWTKYTGVDPEVELLDRRRPDRFHHAPPTIVLHGSPQPPLLTHRGRS